MWGLCYATFGSRAPRSVGDFERRAALWPRARMVVDARGGSVGVAEPFLPLGNVSPMIERVGGSDHAQRIRANLETERAEYPGAKP